MGQTKILGLLNNQASWYQAIAGNKFEIFYLLNTGTGAVYIEGCSLDPKSN